MNRFLGTLAVFALVSALAFAQAPAPAPQAAPQTAAASTVSGCLTQSFGRFSVADSASSKAWEVKGSGNPLWSHANHVVNIQGLPDPKSPTPVLYAQTVQDTNQACGNGQAAAAAQPAGAAPTTASATPSPATGVTTTATTAAPAPAPQAEPQSQPGGAVAQAQTVPAQPSTAAAPQATAGGTTGVTGQAPTTPQTADNTATAASGAQPQGAIASNAGSQPADNNNTVFTGCLNGSVNNYQFKANGKIYRLQGNTTALPSLLNHQVELTGEDFNGKAIQVNGARDLGASCKK